MNVPKSPVSGFFGKALILLIGLAGMAPLAHADEAEEKDFGFRVSAGGISGIGTGLHYEISLKSDFYFLSETLRMTFGTSFLIPNGGDIPVTAVHSLGVEANRPLGPGNGFLGLTYHKSFLQENKNNLAAAKGWAYYAGYKAPLSRTADFLILAGITEQPFQLTGPSPALPLADSPVFFQAGSEWYF